jgi:hypothetical protein
MIENRKICSKCREDKLLTSFSRNKGKPGGYNRYCKKCLGKCFKKWYEKNKHTEHYKELMRRKWDRKKVVEPEKLKARHALGDAIKSGRIKRGVCEMCGSVKTQGHHPNYSKVLYVVWLCKKHHRELHKVHLQGQTN